MNAGLYAHLAQYAAVQHQTNTAASQVYRTTGIMFPTVVVASGVKNAFAKSTHIEIHTGMPAWRIPAVYAHEIAHVLAGHTTYRRVPVRQGEAEADYLSGRLLVYSGQAHGLAGLHAVMSAARGGGGEHGLPAERAMRVVLGMMDAYAGR